MMSVLYVIVKVYIYICYYIIIVRLFGQNAVNTVNNHHRSVQEFAVTLFNYRRRMLW